MDYDKLTFTNNFVFCKVLENNLDLCRQLLELILGGKIKKVELADKEKVLDITPMERECGSIFTWRTAKALSTISRCKLRQNATSPGTQGTTSR